ncbi:hypothetical protein TSACC_2664 [Terrimicrobium sacchariphilum]|uniref:Polysaccharide deacetylase n=1 Tax=Terrimicrobium sacchariphilum TaxID=690879 RepID=A0A146G6C2_TERSA|nr:hypothetical protein [Terrimicrobium sacchariphilum]GAT32266.1 hypothetical protein TSACC_2664 [Terrimicrobium sacchariphilum]
MKTLSPGRGVSRRKSAISAACLLFPGGCRAFAAVRRALCLGLLAASPLCARAEAGLDAAPSSVWFPIVAPTRISANITATEEPALGGPPRAAQTIVKHGDGYSQFSWSGLNLAIPKDRLLCVPVYLGDFEGPGGFALSLTIQLKNESGAISYNFSAGAFRANRWSYLPLWDPASPASAAFSKPGTSVVAADTGFDFSRPVTEITMAPNNLPVGAKLSIGSLETAARTRPVLVVTDDITDDSTYTHIVPIMEAAGFRGGLRIGGFKDASYSPGIVAKLRGAYDKGWDVYNGSWSRTGLNTATTSGFFEEEIVACKTRAAEQGFTRGMTWFSSAGNSLPKQAICREIGAKTGMTIFKSGGGVGNVNLLPPGGIELPAIVTSVGMGGYRELQATGKAGSSTLVVSPHAVGLREGCAVSGPGIAPGTTIARDGIRGATVTLSIPLVADVSGPVTFTDSYEAHQALADGLVFTGGVLVYFLHDLQPEGRPPSRISFPAEDFARVVAYWKARKDAGLLEVLTPSELDARLRGSAQ